MKKKRYFKIQILVKNEKMEVNKESKCSWKGELKLSKAEPMSSIEVEKNPQEFPMLMTNKSEATEEETPEKKEEEAPKKSQDVAEEKKKLPHVHLTRSVSLNVRTLPFETSELSIREIDEMKSLIDYLKEKKVLSELDKQRISIILNVTNEIKDLCKFGIKMMATDMKFFYKMIQEKWENAVKEINSLNNLPENE